MTTTSEDELKSRQCQVEVLLRETRAMRRTIRRLHADVDARDAEIRARDMELHAESAQVRELQAELKSRTSEAVMEASSAAPSQGGNSASSPPAVRSQTSAALCSPPRSRDKAQDRTSANPSADAGAGTGAGASTGSPFLDNERVHQLRSESEALRGELYELRNENHTAVREDSFCEELAFELSAQSQTLREELLQLRNELGQRAADAAVREEETNGEVIALRSELQMELATARAEFNARSNTNESTLQVKLTAARAQIQTQQQELAEAHATINELKKAYTASAVSTVAVDLYNGSRNAQAVLDSEALSLAKEDTCASVSTQGPGQAATQLHDPLSSLCERFAALRRATQDLSEVGDRYTGSQSVARKEAVRRADGTSETQGDSDLEGTDMTSSMTGKAQMHCRALGSKLGSSSCDEASAAQQQRNFSVQAVMSSEDPSAILGSDGGTIIAPDYSFTSSHDDVRGCPSSCGVCEECEWYMLSPISSPTFGTSAKGPQRKPTCSRLGWKMELGGRVAPACNHEVQGCDEIANAHVSSADGSQDIDSHRIPQSHAPNELHAFQQETLKVLSTALLVREVAKNPDVNLGFGDLGFSPGSSRVFSPGSGTKEIISKRMSKPDSVEEKKQSLNQVSPAAKSCCQTSEHSREEEHVRDDVHNRSSEPWLSRTPRSPECSQSSGSFLTQARDDTSFLTQGCDETLDARNSGLAAIALDESPTASPYRKNFRGGITNIDAGQPEPNGTLECYLSPVIRSKVRDRSPSFSGHEGGQEDAFEDSLNAVNGDSPNFSFSDGVQEDPVSALDDRLQRLREEALNSIAQLQAHQLERI